MQIRSEQPHDNDQITQVVQAAFIDHPHGANNEHLIVSQLRKDNAMYLSFVALIHDTLVGHICFSEVHIDGKQMQWYGLGPISVLPEFQRQGVGSALIQHGLNTLKELGASGTVLVGEPTYYQRFGFQHAAQLTFPGVPPEYFMALSFLDDYPSGEVRYHDAFYL
ncbi:GNAT family N-acetyltransferase [Algicola sagamiensis]|uniref:GNAT family N-acetyltransferase n=1 Tax=Algicola sagamiensis TaxID=163869 RepID=UPI00036DA2DD|nr:N-acetyltransferase [Algicola sagamiensis]